MWLNCENKIGKDEGLPHLKLCAINVYNFLIGSMLFEVFARENPHVGKG